MTQDHWLALLETAEATKDPEGWVAMSSGRHLTLYMASGNASLTVNHVEAVRVEGALIKARTVKGDTFVLALESVFAGAVDGPKDSTRKAGFV
jgi:hypothetical protein